MRAYLIAIVSVIALGATASPVSAERFRAEIHSGWDRVQGADQEDDGILYGIGLGYDLNVGRNAFVGVDLSFDDSTTEECETGVDLAGDVACLRAGRDLAAGIRAGVDVGEGGKVYALAGPMPGLGSATRTPPASKRARPIIWAASASAAGTSMASGPIRTPRSSIAI